MDPANSSSDASGYTYGEMVMKAISTINDGNGVDIDGISEFIKERYEVPADFRKRLRNKLKKLVSLSKLEKVENRYKIVNGNSTTEATRPTQTENPDDSTKPQDLPTATEETSEIIDAAVKVVAMAENIEFQAKEEYEAACRIDDLLQESSIILKLSLELFQLCAKGEKIFLR